MIRSYFFGEKLEGQIFFGTRVNELIILFTASMTSIKREGKVFKARVYWCSEQRKTSHETIGSSQL